MTASEYTKIFEGNFIIAQRIIHELENIGISPVLKDLSESGRLAGFAAPISGNQKLYVNNEELSKAQEIVNRVKLQIETQD